MIKSFHIEDNSLYLSKPYLKKYATTKTMEFWGKEMGVVKMCIEGVTFFLYKTIPLRTRKKLPHPDKIISQEQKNDSHSRFEEILKEAYYSKFTHYKALYENQSKFSTDHVTKFSRFHSVLQAIIDLQLKESVKDLAGIYEVFNVLFRDKYKSKTALNNALTKAKYSGIESVAVDKRVYGNNNRESKEFTPAIDYALSLLVSSNAKFSYPQILQKANKYFEENGLPLMSLSWVKLQGAYWKQNPEIVKSRYGQKEAQRRLPYISGRNATLIHVQWQVDGYTLPFWEPGGKGFNRSVLVFVIDNASKKIIGYAIGDTENGAVIKAAIRNAIDNTGVLPFEMVMDRHSFTTTSAAFNLEMHLNSVGSMLTKTSNPRQKIIVERYIQYLDSLFKGFYGYIGKGVKSKSIEDLASDEKRSEYAKNFIDQQKVIAMATLVVAEYNNTGQRMAKGKSPNQVFEENPHPHPINLNQFQKANFLPNQSDKKIDCGQITIIRGIDKYEYQLPAEHYQDWDNKTVKITYDCLQDGIYLYKQNGEGLIHLHQKYKINNAKPLQTDEDIQALNMHKGRLKGIETKGRKQLESVRDRALNIDPEAYTKLSQLVTSKDVLKELEQDSNMKLLAENNGVIINDLDRTEHNFDTPASLKPAKKDSNPFTIKNNKLEIINPADLLDSD